MISKFTTTEKDYNPDIFGDFPFEYYWTEGLNYEILVHDLTPEKLDELKLIYEWVENYELP